MCNVSEQNQHLKTTCQHTLASHVKMSNATVFWSPTNMTVNQNSMTNVEQGWKTLMPLQTFMTNKHENKHKEDVTSQANNGYGYLTVGMCGNRISVFKNPNRTKAIRSNLKFWFPWLFSKPNLSHTNSQYLSHSHKALQSSRYGHCRTVNDHKIKLSVDTMR